MSAVDCIGRNSQQTNFEFTSITAEGQQFSADNFQFIRCHSIKSRSSGFSTVLDALATPTNWVWRECSATGCNQVGFLTPAPGHALIDCSASKNGYEAVRVTNQRVRIEGGTFSDNCQRYTRGDAASSEILVAANQTLISNVLFRRTKAGRARTAVRESQADGTTIRNCKIDDATSAYSSEYEITGQNSVVT